MAESVTVIDASLVIKAILPNAEMALCQAALSKLQDNQLVVPVLWVYEITSALTKAVHFGQLSEEDGRAALHQAFSLGVQIIPPDEVQSDLAFGQTLGLKRASAYDSFYLVVAEALSAEFWTADRKLYHSFQERTPRWMHCVGEIV